MSLFGVSSNVEMENQDTLPSKRSYVVDSGVYPMVIDLAYIDKSSGGATALKIVYKDDTFENITIRETLWVKSSDKKGNKDTYIDSSGKQRYLPGMVQAMSLAKVATGKHLDQLDAEDKVVKLYSFEAKKEVPTQVKVVTDLIGKRLQLGLIKKVENKRVPNGDGTWGPGPERKEFNEVVRHFSEEGFTSAELGAKAKTPEFIKLWKERYDGTVEDKFTPMESSTPAIPETATETKSLFSFIIHR